MISSATTPKTGPKNPIYFVRCTVCRRVGTRGPKDENTCRRCGHPLVLISSYVYNLLLGKGGGDGA